MLGSLLSQRKAKAMRSDSISFPEVGHLKPVRNETSAKIDSNFI